MFTVPQSSSPPSTPDARAKQKQQISSFFAASDVSNTPAGAPPSLFSLASTTPAGPPPSSVYGSVNYNSSIPFPSSRYGKSTTRSSPLKQPTVRDTRDDNDGDAMDEDHDMDMNSFIMSNDQPIQSIEGFNIHAVAKAVAKQDTNLSESDDVIIGSENIVEGLDLFMRDTRKSGEEVDAALASAADQALTVLGVGQMGQIEGARIGPGEGSSPVIKACFVSSLLLPLHHPPPHKQQQPRSMFRTAKSPDRPKPVPEVLVDWLHQHHNPYPEEFKETLEYQPNTCGSDRFWDVVLSRTTRGSIKDALKLLKEADFRQAATALEEGGEEPGYRGKQLGNVQRVVNRAIAVLEACPAIQSEDWNVASSDWSVFRKRIRQALQDLAAFAEGPSHAQSQEDGVFEAENFGLSSVQDSGFSLSKTSRSTESRVPFSVYQALQELYGIMLGNGREITAASADWVEASIGQTIWWDGEAEDVGNVNFSASRNNRQSLARTQGNRPVDLMPRTAYLQKLSLSLRQVLAEHEDVELQVNTTSSVEVALACVFDDDLDGLLSILRGWSSTVVATVVEIAYRGSWLTTSAAPSQNLMDQFSQSDLMILNYSQNKPARDTNSHDDILSLYADLLYDRPMLRSTKYDAEHEGWELAIQVAGRLSNGTTSTNLITRFLEDLPLEGATGSINSVRINKVMSLCQRLSLNSVSQRMARRYATLLVNSTQNYGDALYYYARAHDLVRLKEVLDLLISLCLVQSLAYPPAADLDDTLHAMLTTPKQTLARLNLIDHEAAEMLSIHFSGYAMLRSFYDLRDQVMTASSASAKTALRPIARRKAAAATLIAVITSAADSIYGGLYDASVSSIIPVDGLVVLLGEALVFVNAPNPITPKPILTLTQTSALLSAIESLASLPTASSIHTACADVLQAALAHRHDPDGEASASGILSKSTTSHFSFSVVGRSADSGGFGVLSQESLSKDGEAEGKRAWDWRSGMKRDAGVDDVVKVLRLGLAKEVARGWLG